MYSCVFVDDDDNDRYFWFGLKCGVIFDMDPLGDVDVDIDSEQSYRQIGENIVGYSLDGVSRDLEGVILDMYINGVTNHNMNPNPYMAYNKDIDTDAKYHYTGPYGTAKRMLYVFSPGRTGKLYFFEDEDDMDINNGSDSNSWGDGIYPGINPSYYANVTVEKTPEIHYDEKTRKWTFELSLYSAYPFWTSCEEQEEVISVGTGSEITNTAFSFPTEYSPHQYGVVEDTSEYNVFFSLDAAPVSIPIDVTFEAKAGDITYAELISYNNNDKDDINAILMIRKEIKEGDKVHVYWNSEGVLTATYMELQDDGTYEETSSLDNIYLQSTLFYLDAGSNLYQALFTYGGTDDEDQFMEVTIKYAERSAGVCAKGKTSTVSRI